MARTSLRSALSLATTGLLLVACTGSEAPGQADGQPSAHFEHSVVVRESGGEILSGSDNCDWGRCADA